MTTKPEFDLGSHLLPGLAAVLLFLVMAAAFVGAAFGQPTGFGEDANITASIGYAMFNIDQGVAAEEFLVAFEIIDLVLVAALAGAVLLARREGESFTATIADGGRELRRTVRGDGGDDPSDDLHETSGGER